jgi:hypothetical protein
MQPASPVTPLSLSSRHHTHTPTHATQGANRPQTRKGSGSATTGSGSSGPKKKSQFIDLNVERLVKELDFWPARQVGPVEVAALPGACCGAVVGCSTQASASAPEHS